MPRKNWNRWNRFFRLQNNKVFENKKWLAFLTNKHILKNIFQDDESQINSNELQT